ncbi:CKLF-like MARVEL transmembrane domain-containing protein 5 [Arvicola amphibius]|uniref:CKLF-like MARVEL transmembrane domain-containing protein 5 n=1 Tax=Arvicola amphibius TaxID=1047088 RepID=UPI0018E3BFB2|nr:CKLF-like MARVEL transmembrane domain-containing protein 5 [Arvicola amphibius]
MFNAWDCRERPPEEGAAAGLQGFGVDKNFLSSLKGILLETELALTFIIFICFTASISAYMAAALLEFFITLAFLFLYATQYYQRFDRLNWPCLDFLRCVSAIIIFLVVSFAAVTSREGAAIAAFVFGIILVSVFAYDAFKIYRTELMPRTTEGECLCPARGDAAISAPDTVVIYGFPAWLHLHRGPAVIPGLPGSHDQTQEPRSSDSSSLDSLNLPSAHHLLYVYRDVCLRSPRGPVESDGVVGLE